MNLGNSNKYISPADYAIQLHNADFTLKEVTVELLREHIVAGGGSPEEPSEDLLRAIKLSMILRED